MNSNLIVSRSRSHASRRQGGVALVVCLILLLIMTLAGLSGIRLVTTQERMVGYSYDRTVAFQAAEATLRDVESRIGLSGAPTPAPGAACTSFGSTTTLTVCGVTAATSTPPWITNSFAAWPASPTTVTALVTPRYYVEYLGGTFPCSEDPSTSPSTCQRYRVTVVAAAGGERANVLLQSIYAY